MTIREYLTKNIDKYDSRPALVNACAKELKRNKASVRRVLISVETNYANKIKTNVPATKTPPKKKDTPAGVEGFRQMFSRSEVQARRTKKLLERVIEGIDTVLKERIWIPDNEFREILGINSCDWSSIRRDFEHLIVPDVVDEDKRKYNIWGHPDHVEELREIANE